MTRRFCGIVLGLLIAARAASADTAGGCDFDADGHDALFCGGDDCQDGDPDVYPGAAEIPGDGVDQDCDGLDDSDGAAWVASGGSVVCGSASGGAWWWGLVALALTARTRRRP